MLRTRVVIVLTFCDGVLYRTKLFRPDYRYTLNFVDAWSVDEVVILDVTRPGEGARENFYRVVEEFSRRCFVPLATGGGVRSLDDVHMLMRLGADKVVLNSAALERPQLVTEIAERYGSQCAIVSIDAKQSADGYEVMSRFGAEPTGLTPVAWAKQAEELGAGELLITSIDRDGWLQGYDVDLVRSVAHAVSVPVLALGGAGTWQHMADVILRGGASAACTQNIYHFTEASIRSAKTYLSRAGIAVRC